MSSGIEIVAVGARTAVGLAAAPCAAAVRAGIRRIGEYAFVRGDGEPVVVAADARLPTLLEGRDRLVPLAHATFAEVARKLGAGTPHRGPCRLWLALPEVRPGFSDHDAAWVAESLGSQLRAEGSVVRVELAGRGHAGAFRAVEQATARAARAGGEDELHVIVGVDSYHHPDTFVWLERTRQFAGPGVRSGFAPGEGAGCLVLASPRLRKQLRLPSLGLVDGVATAQETLLRESETGSFGVGMTRAVTGALGGSTSPREPVDTVYADINGERYRSEEWAFVALRAPWAFRSLEYEAPADCWGDVGAATGPLLSVLAVQSWARGYARGPRALVMAGSPGGLRGAMVLRTPQA